MSYAAHCVDCKFNETDVCECDCLGCKAMRVYREGQPHPPDRRDGAKLHVVWHVNHGYYSVFLGETCLYAWKEGEKLQRDQIEELVNKIYHAGELAILEKADALLKAMLKDPLTITDQVDFAVNGTIHNMRKQLRAITDQPKGKGE